MAWLNRDPTLLVCYWQTKTTTRNKQVRERSRQRERIKTEQNTDILDVLSKPWEGCQISLICSLVGTPRRQNNTIEESDFSVVWSHWCCNGGVCSSKARASGECRLRVFKVWMHMDIDTQATFARSTAYARLWILDSVHRSESLLSWQQPTNRSRVDLLVADERGGEGKLERERERERERWLLAIGWKPKETRD